MRQRSCEAINPHNHKGIPLPYRCERAGESRSAPASTAGPVLEYGRATRALKLTELREGILLVRRYAGVTNKGRLSQSI